MRIALVVLCTGEYWKGAKVLFHTLRTYGQLPKEIDCIALGQEECNFANPWPISRSYRDIPVNLHYFAKVAAKFDALRLPYDRIILMDADMLCVGDCSLLWSDRIGELSFYAVRDVASAVYYRNEIQKIGLDPNRLFNAGTMIFQMKYLQGFYDEIIRMISNNSLSSYDGGDQGYLNHYFQKTGLEIGFLPLEYNACTDVHWPRLSLEFTRVVHFTGSNINPWNPRVDEKDRRWGLLQRWKEEWNRCNSPS